MRRPRFTIRALMIAVTVAALGLAVVVKIVRDLTTFRCCVMVMEKTEPEPPMPE